MNQARGKVKQIETDLKIAEMVKLIDLGIKRALINIVNMIQDVNENVNLQRETEAVSPGRIENPKGGEGAGGGRGWKEGDQGQAKMD